jgi:16S rRNA (cytosine1407-C5)-methyltransferase
VNRAFEDYYRGLYGDRWEGLRESLAAERPALAFSKGLREPYYLDPASALAAASLRFPGEAGGDAEGPGERGGSGRREVLDACAAPGGKALIIAVSMPGTFRLVANELSGDRRRRLAGVLDRYLPGEIRTRVSVSGFDAAALGGRKRERNRFAAALLDAPCSSEGHVLKDPAALAAWTPARPRFLAGRQWALLSSVFLLLEKGGSLVYVTCAISEEENDGVAGRLAAKYGAGVLEDPPSFAQGERTRRGVLLLPDRCSMGPMYVARFRKAP